MGKMILSGKGRRWLLSGHPWVYADDVADGKGEPGELVPVEGPNGDALGWALFSNSSRIALRMVTRGSEQPNRDFWLGLVRRALRRREQHGMLDPEGACRLIAGDADGLPGFVFDRYGTIGVLQCGTQGADRMRGFLVELVEEVLAFPLTTIVDRSDTSVRRFENLEERTEVVRGTLPDEVLVREGEVVYEVDVLQGHKTGAYLDQSVNRARAARHAVRGRALDAFAYDGLFGIHAALAGAEEVVCLEQNQAACARIQRNAERNGVADRVRVERANCMQELRNRTERDERYSLVVVDPPAFARNRKEAAGAERGYVELNRRAFALAEEGGVVVSASCSYNVRAEAFVGHLASAAHLAERQIVLEELAGAGPDHPHLITLPESQYLKCAFLRVD